MDVLRYVDLNVQVTTMLCAILKYWNIFRVIFEYYQAIRISQGRVKVT